jgi:DNA-binding transcriptional LysR family regulator
MDPRTVPVSDIAIFVAIVECGSISTAARRLQLSQPTVSKKLHQLEALFGTQLLHRSTHHVSLSEAGKEVYRSFKAIIAEWDDICDRLSGLSGELRGTLRIHSIVRLGEQIIAPIVAEFMEAHPTLTIHLSLNSGNINLIEEGYDLEIRHGPESDENDSKSLECRNLGLIRFGIWASPQYVERHGLPETPEDLEDHNCIIHTTQRSSQDWPFKGKRGTHFVRVNGSLHTNNQIVTNEALLRGLGIARMPHYAVRKFVEAKQLIALFPDLVVHDTHLLAFYPRGPSIPRKTESFLDFVEERVKGSVVVQ